MRWVPQTVSMRRKLNPSTDHPPTLERPEMSDQTPAVRSVLQDYFDALYDGDVEKFARVFHPACRLFTVAEGGVMTLDYDAYLKRVGGRPSPRSRGDAREDEILSLTISAPTLAHARVKDCYLPGHYINELTMLKVDGSWRIAAKVWHAAA